MSRRHFGQVPRPSTVTPSRGVLSPTIYSRLTTATGHVHSCADVDINVSAWAFGLVSMSELQYRG
jgi:hypothetical protein